MRKASVLLRNPLQGESLEGQRIAGDRCLAGSLHVRNPAVQCGKKRSGREDIRLLKGSPHKKRTGKTPRDRGAVSIADADRSAWRRIARRALGS